MLLAEDLYLDSDPVETTTILLTHHNSSPAPMMSGSSTIPQNNQPQIQQYPYPTLNASASTYGGHNFGGNRNSNRNGSNFGGNRNNRNGNRNGFPQGFTGLPQGFTFPAGTCQICGRNNHQAYSCYYRQNLNYKPSQYVTNNQFGSPNGQPSQYSQVQGSQFVPQGVS